MKCRSAKNKGKRLQNWVCQKISELLNIPWGNDLPIESRGMGQPGVDVRMESHVKKMFPYSIECKNQENFSVHKWVEQSIANQEQGTDWLLVCKSNRRPPIVIMDAERFFEIHKKIVNNDR